MKITDIKTYLMQASVPGGGWTQRNWLFVKVFTDEGIYGVGEASGWPRVVETAIQDLREVVIGEDPFLIERIWQKIYLAMMGHGMTGIVGGGALTGIEMALWDIKGKALGVPVWNLLGGKIRDRIRLYAHAQTAERAQELVARGFSGLKTGGVVNPIAKIRTLREAVGPEIDLMADVHGPPWFSVRDAIRVGQALEEFDLLFYEDPVPPEHVENLAKVARHVNLPIAAGERHTQIYGVRELIEREIVDVIQPDTGRAGGLMQMKKMAAMAEAHGIGFAPHDGSLGPVAEMAAVHLLATLPNFLILEHLEDDAPQRYEVMQPQPEIVEGSIVVPDTPGLGVDIVEDAIARYPSAGNVSTPRQEEYVYFQAKYGRAKWLEQ
ncbi:MAG: mandelate racemase/muconate lactonizing enzyme family protein [Caldilineaceae bacterium SB0661_bin_32]|uniref:Mandelate racemase/muconate lactonizing enzyme family protein n=1 Tax=Caldilineaceae bacterium SB0661_bin_32 TaxID=2605255 RepID=A0A6B1DBN1_9CHLR|nr:mandelate racemase/muconate lactonizing enzyme family protein [Caldilineaceae bacterium SB0661_bin_32]